MIRKVHLMGNLGEKFGPVWNVHCTTVSECLRLIECQTDNFRKYLIDIVNQGTNFSVRTGKELLETGEQLFMNVNEEDIYITEVPAGSGGWGKILVGAAFIIAAVLISLTPGGQAAGFSLIKAGMYTLAAVGISLVNAGVAELLMPQPQKGKPGGAIFNGPVNTLKQGQPVPLLYGELIVGGAPISVSYTKNAPTSTGIAYTELIGASLTGDGTSILAGIPASLPSGAVTGVASVSVQPGASFDPTLVVDRTTLRPAQSVTGDRYYD